MCVPQWTFDRPSPVRDSSPLSERYTAIIATTRIPYSRSTSLIDARMTLTELVWHMGADLAPEAGTLRVGTDVTSEVDRSNAAESFSSRCAAQEICLVGGHLRQRRCIILLLRVYRDVRVDCVRGHVSRRPADRQLDHRSTPGLRCRQAVRSDLVLARPTRKMVVFDQAAKIDRRRQHGRPWIFAENPQPDSIGVRLAPVDGSREAVVSKSIARPKSS